MTEIYSSEPNLKRFTSEIQGRPTEPVADSLVGIVRATNDKHTFTDPTSITFRPLDIGEYEYAISNNHIAGYKFAEVEIKYSLPDYGDFTDRDMFDVVRRLINFSELNRVLGEYEIDYPTFSEVETNVRMIIESHTGQSFNYWRGSQKVPGHGSDIYLPQHLDILDSVSRFSSILTNADLVLAAPGFELSGSGFVVSNRDVIETASYFHSSPRDTDYEITGLWGYQSVPMKVRQAAIELIRGNLCEDMEYRRRYIDNVRSGDVRIQFNPSAYIDSTGNPIADELLSEYVRLQYGAV